MTLVILSQQDRHCKHRFHRYVANLWSLSAIGGVLVGTPNEDNYSRPSILWSMVAERKSRTEGYRSASYVVPDFATDGALLSIQMHFRLVLERWILRHACPML